MDYIPKYNLKKVKNFTPSTNIAHHVQIIDLIKNNQLDKLAYWLKNYYAKNPLFTGSVEINGKSIKLVEICDIHSSMITAALSHNAKDIVDFLLHDPIHKEKNRLIYPECFSYDELNCNVIYPDLLEYILKNKVWYSLPSLCQEVAAFDEDMMKRVCIYFVDKKDLKSVKQLKTIFEDDDLSHQTENMLQIINEVLEINKIKRKIEKVTIDPCVKLQEKIMDKKNKLKNLEKTVEDMKEEIRMMENSYIEYSIQMKKKSTLGKKI